MNLNKLRVKAETNGIYTVDSEAKNVLFCYCDREFLIITRNKGVVRIAAKDLPVILEELQGIVEDVADLERMGVKK